mgnify:CR=1 FL=1
MPIIMQSLGSATTKEERLRLEVKIDRSVGDDILVMTTSDSQLRSCAASNKLATLKKEHEMLDGGSYSTIWRGRVRKVKSPNPLTATIQAIGVGAKAMIVSQAKGLE